MHELSIALGILKIAENEAAKANTKKIESIELEIGTLAGIEFESLDFVWPCAVKNTILEHAKRETNIINAIAKCVDCDTVFDVKNHYDSCPKCSSNFKIILQGKELRVKSLEVL